MSHDVAQLSILIECHQQKDRSRDGAHRFRIPEICGLLYEETQTGRGRGGESVVRGC